MIVAIVMQIMAKRFKRSTDESWKIMEIRKDILEKSFEKRSGRVMFPSSHDIVDISPFKEASLTVLENLLSHGNDVLVTTKPRLSVVKDIESKLGGYRELMQFRFTITSRDDELLGFWEPNAPSFRERLTSLRFAFKKGYKTSVSIEPFLDYNPIRLVRIVEPYTTESIWIGRMNYLPRKNILESEKPFYEKIRRNYETDHLWSLYNRLGKIPRIRFKDSIRNQLGLDSGLAHARC